MPVDHEHRIIFVHIPKTGGTSVLTLLGLWAPARAPNFGTLFGDVGDVDLQHLTLSQLQPFLTPEEFRTYFKFAIVRNPWDRAVSAAFWQTRFPETGVRDLRDYVEWAERIAGKPNAAGRISHVLSQSSFLTDSSGNLAVDRIGRFETFEQDIRNILHRYIDVNQPLPHKLKRDVQCGYRDYYSADLALRVGRLYEEDVARFGYFF